MTPGDVLAAFKQRQREMWSSFGPAAILTTPVAAHLVKFAGIAPGERVLDVATGTGVAAVTAARVSGLDLTPELLEEARENSRIALVEIEWKEGDAERLPWPDASFDVVISQFGHIFAPRPEIAISEMRRVLKPGGRVAFATWPPEHMVGRFFMLLARYSPPPRGVSPPALWGNPTVIEERLAAGFDAPLFARGVMSVPALSPEHFRVFRERSAGPLRILMETLASDPGKAQRYARTSTRWRRNTIRTISSGRITC